MNASLRLLLLLFWLLLSVTYCHAQAPSRAAAKKAWRVVILSTLPADESRAFLAEMQARVSRALLKTDVLASFEMVVMELGQTVEQPISAALHARPDLLVVMAASLATEARRQAPQIPIVFKTVFDPVATGLVESAIRPGRNMTGYSNHAAIHEKRWELLSQAAPKVRKIGVLLNHTYYQNVAQRLPVTLAGGVDVVLLKWQVADGLPALGQLMRQGNVDALDVGLGVAQPDAAAALVQWALENRMPTIFYATRYVKQGGLLAYVAIPLDPVTVLSEYVREILLGASAGNLPISYPKLFSTSINAATVAALNLKPPAAFLKRIDHWELK